MGLLYEAECKDVDAVELLATLEIAPDPFAEELVRGVAGRLDELDALVAARAVGWDLGRMPALDRALLRMASYELAHRPDSPTAVVLAEAVDLASRFSTEDSGRFVNGVLASVATAVRARAGRSPVTDAPEAQDAQDQGIAAAGMADPGSRPAREAPEPPGAPGVPPPETAPPPETSRRPGGPPFEVR